MIANRPPPAGPMIRAAGRPDLPELTPREEVDLRLLVNPVPARDPIALVRESLCSRESLWT